MLLRAAVSSWLARARDRLDWTPHLQYVASLEGSKLSPAQLADRVRSRVEHVVPVDVLQEDPLGPAATSRHEINNFLHVSYSQHDMQVCNSMYFFMMYVL